MSIIPQSIDTEIEALLKLPMYRKDEPSEAVTPEEERIQSVKESYEAVRSGRIDLDEQWAAFQSKFDELTKVMVGQLGPMLGGQSADELPAITVPVDTAAQVLRRSRNVVFLTGAGISAESGIPTFRGSDGFWTIGSTNYRPQEMATFEMFDKNPAELWKWYHQRWRICRHASPNPGHYAVAELEKLVKARGGSFNLVTQNIDGLHLSAGSSAERTFQVHGSMNFIRCDESQEGSCGYGISQVSASVNPEAQAKLRAAIFPWGEEWSDERVEESPIPYCAKCGTRCRPEVLWFDESYDETHYRRESALAACNEADCLVVVGTTLTTGLPSKIVRDAKERGIPIINFDPDSASEPREGMLNVPMKSGEALPALVEKLKVLLSEPDVAPLRQPDDTPSQQIRTSAVKETPAARRPLVKAAAPASRRRSAAPAEPRRPVVDAKGAAAKWRRSVSKEAPKRRGSPPTAAAPEAVAEPAVAAAIHEEVLSDDVRHFFVYGTLRPDYTPPAPWTKKFVDLCTARPALLRGASLYAEDYAAVVLEDTAMAVRGMILSFDDEKTFQQKLKDADEIEGYPDLYERCVQWIDVLDEKAPANSPPCRERAWVYHRTGRVDRSAAPRLAGGDWLHRPGALAQSGKGRA